MAERATAETVAVMMVVGWGWAAEGMAEEEEKAEAEAGLMTVKKAGRAPPRPPYTAADESSEAKEKRVE